MTKAQIDMMKEMSFEEAFVILARKAKGPVEVDASRLALKKLGRDGFSKKEINAEIGRNLSYAEALVLSETPEY